MERKIKYPKKTNSCVARIDQINRIEENEMKSKVPFLCLDTVATKLLSQIFIFLLITAALDFLGNRVGT